MNFLTAFMIITPGGLARRNSIRFKLTPYLVEFHEICLDFCGEGRTCDNDDTVAFFYNCGGVYNKKKRRIESKTKRLLYAVELG